MHRQSIAAVQQNIIQQDTLRKVRVGSTLEVQMQQNVTDTQDNSVKAVSVDRSGVSTSTRPGGGSSNTANQSAACACTRSLRWRRTVAASAVPAQ